MKKIFSILIFGLLGAAVLFAVSYDNNEYQRRSRALTRQAQIAYDDGDYDAAVAYANEAERNAELSALYIESMLSRAEAQTELYRAGTRRTWAKDKKAETYFPSALESAEGYIISAQQSFSEGEQNLTARDFSHSMEKFAAAKLAAQNAVAALSVVREIIPLPATYEVDPWDESKDCFWNIAANPAVYGDPMKWEELYKANRSSLKRPSNPNLIMPGMIVTIPSIAGEIREGLYDPSIKYEPFKEQIKNLPEQKQ
ncbi:hypothetical protein K7I13_12845 [Brucepastera parasyntrophica]|uniref:LysM peptidoglycan-binding domain-containing protein n=1 Tax=Brucepastera parasyntrophica TaxID=2880008 RepID=UPI00210B6C2C|nr:hypothetical protein [Brucepastera parasyntrophica]ULQ59358.1 hypothetical protein K7I13_12845 [Brucepastera parasyntrophica]